MYLTSGKVLGYWMSRIFSWSTLLFDEVSKGCCTEKRDTSKYCLFENINSDPMLTNPKW